MVGAATPVCTSAVTAAWISARRSVRVPGASGRDRASTANGSVQAHQAKYASTSARKLSDSSAQATRRGGARNEGRLTDWSPTSG